MSYSSEELINYLLLHSFDLHTAILHYLCDNLDTIDEAYVQYSYQNPENVKKASALLLDFWKWFQEAGYVQLGEAFDATMPAIEVFTKLRMQAAMCGNKAVFDLQVYKHVRPSSEGGNEDPILASLNQLLTLTKNEK